MIGILMPILAQLLGNGLNMVTNAALVKGKDWLLKETGVDLNVPLTPESTATLQKYQADNAVQLAQIHLEQDQLSATLQQLQFADVASARTLQASALNQEDVFSKRFIYYFTAAITIFTFLYIILISFAPIPLANQRFVDVTQGVLIGSVFVQVINFFYGSSKTSQTKDTTISNAVGALNANS